MRGNSIPQRGRDRDIGFAEIPLLSLSPDKAEQKNDTLKTDSEDKGIMKGWRNREGLSGRL
jgi:hypothetical protein